MQKIKIIVALSAIIAGSVMALEPNNHLFQIADLHKIQDVGAPSLSPNGQQVIYTVSTHNMTIDSTVSDIWTVNFYGGKAKNLTNTSKKSEWSPKFSPNGKKIAFLGEAKNDGQTQIFIMNTSKGRAKQVSNVEGGIIDFNWAPDSRQLVFSAFVGGEKKSSAGTAAPIVIDRFQFKEDWVGYLAGARRQLHILDIDTKKAVQITHGDADHWLPAWSPDSQWISFVSKDRDDADRNMDYDVFIMAAKVDGKARRMSNSTNIDVDPYWESPPAWSADSQKLVWLTSGESKWIYYHPWQLTVTDISTGKVTEVARIDRNFYQPKWSTDGLYIYSLIEQDRVTHVAKIELSTGNINYLTNGNSFALSFDLASNGNIVVQQSDDNRPFELVAIGTSTEVITQHNNWLKDYKLAQTAEFNFSSDGHAVSGLIVYPPDYDKTKAYPAIFRLHGGPAYQFSHEFMYDWQIYAAQGYIVVGINPRGSSGKGFDFSKAIYADWGHVDADDIFAGVDYLTALSIVDSNRLGVGGWSYGGMLTNYVIATDNRFKAAVSGAGTANMLGNYGYDQYSREYELELGTLWDNLAAYQRVSFPFLHPKQIKTPTLYQCSELDFNVPCLGAEQMYQALKSVGTSTRLVIYPGQYHGITVPSYLADRMQRNLAWYDQYLREEK